MVDTPYVHVSRFAQLNEGDLFLLLDGDCRCVAFCVDNPSDNDKLTGSPIMTHWRMGKGACAST